MKFLFFLNFSCAFPNTPKFVQVKQTGKGFIVNKQWILDCYKQNQLLSEKNYELKGYNNNITKRDQTNRISEKKQTKIDNNMKEHQLSRKTSIEKKMKTFDDDDDDEDEEVTDSINVKQHTFDDEDDSNIFLSFYLKILNTIITRGMILDDISLHT